MIGKKEEHNQHNINSMIKIKNIIGLPSLQYHLDNDLTLHENVYRYSSESFILLFAEAREQWRDGYIQLNEQDTQLIESTDIGLYGEYQGKKVPLDLPMLNEANKISDDKLMRLVPKMPKGYVGKNTGIGKYTISTPDGKDIVLTQSKDKKNWSYEPSNVALKTLNEDEQLDENKLLKQTQLSSAEYQKAKSLKGFNADDYKWDGDLYIKIYSSLNEAEYQGKDVALNKPKRGGSKKFYVYTKNKKGNVVKVSFGGTTGLNVKIDEPGARSSFAARHKCATKKDKTKPGYWSCNIGRYWKSLGGKRNFSGYW